MPYIQSVSLENGENMSTPTNVLDYKQLIIDYYGGIYHFGSVDEWEKASGIGVASRINSLDLLLPEEVNRRSKMKLYIDPATGSICNAKGHYIPQGSSRWSPGATFVPNKERSAFFYNDIVTVECATAHYSGGLSVYSHKFKKPYYLMTRNLTKEMFIEMTKGVLIGSFTFEKTGGYLSIKMVPVK